MSELAGTLARQPTRSGWSRRLWKMAGSVSIRTKIMGIVLALTVILGLGVTWEVRTVMAQVFINELESRGQSVVSDLAARSVDPILLNDTYSLYQLLTETVANHPDALYAFVVDSNGHVLAHTFGEEGFPVSLLDKNPLQPDNQIHQFHYNSNRGRIHDFMAPIFDGRAGYVRLGLTETRLRGIIDAVTGQMLLTTLVVAVIGILAAMLLTWLLTRPILSLVETTRQVGQGNLAARASHWADDEIGALADAFNQMVADLQVSRQAIAEKEAARGRLLEQLINAQEEERKRIARELHDGVGQSLTSLTVGLKVAGQIQEPVLLQQKYAEMHQVAVETLDQVRLLSRELRPSVLDDLGLAAALERYVVEFTQLYPELHVDLHCDLGERLSPTTETTLYRIIQEAMTNAARHGDANTVSVLVSRRDGKVQAIIEDDGHGFDPVAAQRAGESVGIHAMMERAELVGGSLAIESGEEGTTVYAEVPT